MQLVINNNGNCKTRAWKGTGKGLFLPPTASVAVGRESDKKMGHRPLDNGENSGFQVGKSMFSLVRNTCAQMVQETKFYQDMEEMY